MQIINTPLNVRGRLIENTAPNFTTARNIPLSTRTNSLGHSPFNKPDLLTP